MNLTKYFEDTFQTKCILTEHSLKRLTTRFMNSELIKLKYLVQAAMHQTPLTQWKDEESTVLIDSRFNFSIVCVYYTEAKVLKIISFIRGKTEEAYKNCKTISVSIMKEKADQEALELNNKLKYKNKKVV